MFRLSGVFFALSIVSILFGAYEVAGFSLAVGESLLVLFLTLSMVTLVAGMFNGRNQKQLR